MLDPAAPFKAIALAPEPSTAGPNRRNSPPASPSFVIRGAVGVSVAAPRWDRINSAVVIRRARQIYFAFLQSSLGGSEPSGIVLTGPEGDQGRVVFETPVLLPEEQFIPLDLVRGRTGRGRTPRSFTRG